MEYTKRMKRNGEFAVSLMDKKVQAFYKANEALAVYEREEGRIYVYDVIEHDRTVHKGLTFRQAEKLLKEMAEKGEHNGKALFND